MLVTDTVNHHILITYFDTKNVRICEIKGVYTKGVQHKCPHRKFSHHLAHRFHTKNLYSESTHLCNRAFAAGHGITFLWIMPHGFRHQNLMWYMKSVPLYEMFMLLTVFRRLDLGIFVIKVLLVID